MVHPPVFQELEQVVPRDKAKVLPQVDRVLPDLVMQGFVPHEVGIPMLLHDVLFMLEVSKRVLKQQIHDRLHGLAVLALPYGLVQAVDSFEDLLVLGVDRRVAHRIEIFPDHEGNHGFVSNMHGNNTTIGRGQQNASPRHDAGRAQVPSGKSGSDLRGQAG